MLGRAAIAHGSHLRAQSWWLSLLPADGRFSCLCPGETIKIVIEDYVQHLSGYYLKLKFDPELLFGTQFQYRNRIAVEFNQLYHWHGLMPDSFIIQGQEYSYEQFLYNTSMLMDYGVEALVESFSKQVAGRVRSCSPLPARAEVCATLGGCSWYCEGSTDTAVTNIPVGRWVLGTRSLLPRETCWPCHRAP